MYQLQKIHNLQRYIKQTFKQTQYVQIQTYIEVDALGRRQDYPLQGGRIKQEAGWRELGNLRRKG